MLPRGNLALPVSYTHLDVYKRQVLGWSSAGTIARLTRSNLLEIMRNDYIRTARAKGLRERAVVVKHALKNAMLPVVTVMAIQDVYKRQVKR